MPLFYLILAHLLADFPLQPPKLVFYKQKTYQGVILHALIFLGLSLIFLFPYLKFTETWLILILLALSHAFIDQAKINYQLLSDKHMRLFFLDQFFHFLFLIGAGLSLKNLPIIFPSTYFFQNIYLNTDLITYFSLLIFVIYVVDIINKLSKHPFAKKSSRPRAFRISKRILAFATIYGLFILYKYFYLTS